MPSDFRWHSFLVSAGYLPDTEEVVQSDWGEQVYKKEIRNNENVYFKPGYEYP